VGHKCSPSGDHPKVPRVGDAVLFVPECYGVPRLVVVVMVHMQDMEDLNVWRWRTDPSTGQPTLVVDQNGQPVPVEWPNPNLELLDDDGNTHMTRQIRYRGSPGWTWPLSLGGVTGGL